MGIGKNALVEDGWGEDEDSDDYTKAIGGKIEQTKPITQEGSSRFGGHPSDQFVAENNRPSFTNDMSGSPLVTGKGQKA